MQNSLKTSRSVQYQRVHTIAKFYECSNSRTFFTCKITLVGHQRMHTGKRTYEYTECVKLFCQSSSFCISEFTSARWVHWMWINSLAKAPTLFYNRVHIRARPYEYKKCGKASSLNPYFFSTRESIQENELLSSTNVKNYLAPSLASLNIGEISAQEESAVTEKAVNQWSLLISHWEGP